jgi:hypothetical protein
MKRFFLVMLVATVAPLMCMTGCRSAAAYYSREKCICEKRSACVCKGTSRRADCECPKRLSCRCGTKMEVKKDENK